jgi:arsenate reductase
MKILFICTHNRCRSILAEAITNHIAGKKIVAVSAGSSPQSEVHPMTLKYLAEHKISIEGLKSKSSTQFENFKPDAIITLCDSAANEACPNWFGDSIQVHWGLVDPSKSMTSIISGDEQSDQRQRFNHTIGILERRIDGLLDSDIHLLKGERLRDALCQIADQIQ